MYARRGTPGIWHLATGSSAGLFCFFFASSSGLYGMRPSAGSTMTGLPLARAFSRSALAFTWASQMPLRSGCPSARRGGSYFVFVCAEDEQARAAATIAQTSGAGNLISLLCGRRLGLLEILGRTGEKRASVRCLDGARVHAIGAILCSRSDDDDLLAGLDEVLAPTIAVEGVGRAGLDVPGFDFAGIFVDRLHVDPGVGVDPVHFGELAIESDDLVGIEFGGERVVGEKRERTCETPQNRGAEGQAARRSHKGEIVSYGCCMPAFQLVGTCSPGRVASPITSYSLGYTCLRVGTCSPGRIASASATWLKASGATCGKSAKSVTRCSR